MKAIVIREHSAGVEALRFEERPLPAVGAGEVRVLLHAISLNHLDTWVRRGVPGHVFPLPLVPGCDGAGTIDAIGAGCMGDWRAGERVVLMPGVSCGLCAMCGSGRHQLCRHYGVLGETRDGTCAEMIVVAERNLLRIPETMSFHSAAAFPLVFLTAWHMLMERCRVQPGQSVLVHAAGSGVSSAAIQIAKLAGCRVLATAGSEAKLALATRLGASVTINYAKEDWVQRVRAETGKRGVDVVVDHIGQDTMGKSIGVLAKGGAMVTCGATTGAQVTFNMARVFFHSLSILGSTMGSLGELHTILDLIARGRLHPVIDSVLPFSDIAQAHRRMGERDVAGKIVLDFGVSARSD